MRRSVALLNTVLVIGLLLAACAPRPTEAPPEEVPEEQVTKIVEGETVVEEVVVTATPPEEVAPLIIGTTDSVTDLDPAQSYDFHTWEIHHNTMDTLLTYIPGTTDLQPALAESYEVSDDGLEYTFKLREGLMFPDGTPFDADDVVWSISRVMQLAGNPSYLVTDFVDRVEFVDDHTVNFVLKEPIGAFPQLVATPPYAPVSPECYPEDEFDSDSTCGGIGPYTIVRWERGEGIELEANPDYYGDQPAHPRVIVRYFADSTAMRLALEAGDIDVAWKTLTPSDYNDFRADANYNVTEAGGPYIRYICFNATTPPFDNPLVRQAISLAIDRDAISGVVFQGTHQNLYSMVPMGMAGHIDAFGERDLDAAVALLAEAGFDASNPLVMDFWWTPDHYGPTEGDVAAVIKQALEETGVIEVNLQSAEWATYTDYFGPGTMPVFLLGWYPDYLDPDNYTWSFAESEASDDIGIFYSGAEMDDLLRRAQVETDPAVREDLYHQIQELWTTEVPTIPFTQGILIAISRPDVGGVILDPTLFLHYFMLNKKVVTAEAEVEEVLTATAEEGVVTVMDDFNGTDPERADIAYAELFAMGFDAIEPLLENLEHTEPFAGSAWVNSSSSVAIYAPATGRVALYLVEAIIRNEQVPHFLPRLICADDRDDEQLFEEAKQLYRAWWSEHQEDALAGQEVPHPLADSGIFWY